MAGRASVVTIQRDEAWSLPIWLGYYGQHFAPDDMTVLDHESSEPSVVALLDDFRNRGGHVIPVHHPVVYASDEDIKVNTAGGFIRDTATEHVRRLLESYDYVLYTDCDELVIPKSGTLREFIDNATEPAYRCTGREVVEGTQHFHPDFCKTLLARIPLNWVWGFHYSTPEFPVRDDIWLYHLHRLDFDAAWAKDKRWHGQHWTPEEEAFKLEAFRAWFYSIHTSGFSSDHLNQTPEPLDERISGVLADLGVLPTGGPSPEALPAWQVPTNDGPSVIAGYATFSRLMYNDQMQVQAAWEQAATESRTAANLGPQ